MRITKHAANRGLDADTETLIVLERMACNVVHHSSDAGGRGRVPREARSGVDRLLMDFAYDDMTVELVERLQAFMDEYVYPAEPAFFRRAGRGRRSLGHRRRCMEELKAEARGAGPVEPVPAGHARATAPG